jgi:uncharacterized repeat protein (TIGR01451 family)
MAASGMRDRCAKPIVDIIMRRITIFRKSPRLAEGACWRAVVVAISLFISPSAPAQRQVLHGHLPPAAARLQATDSLDQSKPMSVLVGLPLRNREALTNFLSDLHNPASPAYHHYLTPAQFTEKFGPTPEDYEAVIAFARSSRLTVGPAYANRTLLKVGGTVADIERVFNVHMRVYRHPTENRAFFAPDTEPSVDLATPVLGVTGLDNYVIPHPLSVLTTKKNQARPMSGSGPGGLYWGNDFRAAYVPGTTLTGAGQTVGMFELDDYSLSDITNYEGEAGLPDVPVTRLLLDGATLGDGFGTSGQMEVSLDIEMAIAMAPGLSGVIVYEGPNQDDIISANTVLNCMATNDAANQLSCSWGFSIDSSTVQIFQQYDAQGQSFFLASGDTGAFTGAAQPPADDPYVTVVGGTTLTTTGAGGSWASEEVWNWNTTGEGAYASTGGISTTYTIPSWQAPVSMASNQGSTTMRNIPDVAMTADQIFIIYDGSTAEVGGTSCAAPLWAGFTALVNQQCVSNQRPPVGFLNPALYALGLGADYAATFHDITTGCNTNASITNEFFAVPGYDLCTGWGTPAGTNMINALAPPPTPLLTGTAALAAESCLPTNGVIDPGETVTVNLTLTNLSPDGTTNLVATMQAGSAVILPTGPQTYGALVQGQSAITRPFTFTASGVCGETIALVWQLQDGPANLGSISLNFTLGTPTSATTFAQNFDSVTPSALPAGWTTGVTGSQINWVTTNSPYETAPNSVYATDVANLGVAYLYSPVIAVASTNAQLTFWQDYVMESHHSTYYDGGVLDIAIGSGSFNDIISSGGSFVTGGYKGTLDSGNPLAGRQAWGGSSKGWITTTVTLPAAAAGQNVQLRWGCATDDGNYYLGSGWSGWAVDTISLKDAYYTCCGDSANLSVIQTAAPLQLTLGQDGVYTITVTNAGPDLATDVTVTDTLPSEVAFVSASTDGVYSNGIVTWPVGSIPSNGSSTMTVTVLAEESGFITNTVSAVSVTPQSPPGSNTVVNVTTINTPPGINAQPSNVTVVAGTNAGFQVAATGSAPLSYQWFFDSTNTIAGANGAQLMLTNVQPGQAGSYSVVVSNIAGSLPSASAVLRVLVSPVVVDGSVTLIPGNGISISVDSVPGLNYTLEYKNFLTDPAWTILPASTVAGTGGVIILQDAAPSQAQCFYQVIAN